MANDKFGPWRRADYESFMNLGTELKPPDFQTLSGFIARFTDPAGAKNDEARRVSDAWAVRRAHPIYLWLDERPEFHELLRLFEERQKRAAPASKIVAPNAPFILLQLVVEWTAMLFGVLDFEKRSGTKHVATRPTKARRDRAVRHADALIKLSNEGVSCKGIEGAQLRRLLIRFREEISSVRRLPRGGKGSSIRAVLEYFALQLIAQLGLSSPSILENFAALTDVNCDNKTAQRYFRRAKKTYGQLLGESLGKQPDT